jgi:hypothetical protein
VRKFLLGAAVAAASAVFAVALAANGASARSASRNGVVRPATSGQPAPLAGGVFKSVNWSGYVTRSKTHRITAVKSAFISPNPTSQPGYSSTWTGIGGFTSHDLIQAGTSEFVYGSGPHYFAWYEMLPGPETHLHNCTGDPLCTVTGGDHMSVNIKRLPSGKWRISITDASNGWSWTKTVSYSSSRSSAEWILEAPTVGGGQSKLPQGLGTSFFGPTSKYTANGSTRTIAQGNPVTVDMVYGHNKPEATPSPLASDDQSFNVCAYASSCPTPP